VAAEVDQADGLAVVRQGSQALAEVGDGVPEAGQLEVVLDADLEALAAQRRSRSRPFLRAGWMFLPSGSCRSRSAARGAGRRLRRWRRGGQGGCADQQAALQQELPA
jgi:hypothetical protein